VGEVEEYDIPIRGILIFGYGLDMDLDETGPV
jgi:hypothetical protein